MPLPWKQGAESGVDRVLVMASSLEMKHGRTAFGFMRAASTVRRQLRGADGLIGYSLIAQPHRKTFWTLSAWRDQAALDAFVGAQPHHRIVDHYRPEVHGRFVTWSLDLSRVPKARSRARALWTEGKARLAAAGDAST